MYKTIKTKSKTLRVIVQLAVVLAALGWLASVTVEHSRPAAQKKDEWLQRNGFLAISYGGISRSDGEQNLSRGLLRRHMEALADEGYEAITVEDIVDFYNNDALLPEKAVFIMFEGGRRDSAVYGQEVLVNSGLRATMFPFSSMLSAWDRSFLTRSQLGTLGRSRFWDVGTLGHSIYLPDELAAHAAKLEKEGHPEFAGWAARYYLADYKRNPDGTIAETPEQFQERARADYDNCDAILNKILGHQPLARIFMPANTLGGSSDPVITKINRELMKNHYRVAFTKEGQGFNYRWSDPHELTRLRVPADCTVEELFDHIALWAPSREPYSYSPETARRKWRREFGDVAFLDHSIHLEAGEGASAMAALMGSEGWKDIEASFTADPTADGQLMYLRFTTRESFIRLAISEGALKVLERLPGHGLEVLFSKELPEENAVDFLLFLRNDRLGIWVDGNLLTDYFIPVITGTPGAFALEATVERVRPGRVVLGTLPQPAATDEETNGDKTGLVDIPGRLALEASGATGDASASFSNLEIRPIAPRWRVVDNLTVDPADDAIAFIINPEGLPVEEARKLLDAADKGFERYAQLPVDELSLDILYEPLAEMPDVLRERLWTGVVFKPSGHGSVPWPELDRASMTAKAAGLRTAFRLTVPQLDELAEMRDPPQVDYLLVEGELPTKRTRAALLRRHAILLYEKNGDFEEGEL